MPSSASPEWVWTSREEVADDLIALLPELHGPRRARAQYLLAHLAVDDHLPVFAAQVRDALRNGIPDPVALGVFARLGGTLTVDEAQRWRSIGDNEVWTLARATAPSDVLAVFGAALSAADPETLRGWIGSCATAPAGTGGAALRHAALVAWLPNADVSDPRQQWTLEQALPHPSAVRALITLPLERWPLRLMDLFWSDPEALLRPLLADHPSHMSSLTSALAMPHPVVVPRWGGAEPALDGLAARIAAIEAHAVTEADVRRTLAVGQTVGGEIASRVRGGWRATIGPVAGFVPASRGADLSPGMRTGLRVIKAKGETLVLEPVDVDLPLHEGPPEPLLADTTIRLAATWGRAAPLMRRLLDGPAHLRAFRVLRVHQPAAVTAWALAREPQSVFGWVARLDARRWGPLHPHLEELAGALRGSKAQQQAAVRVLETADEVPEVLVEALAALDPRSRIGVRALVLRVRAGAADVAALLALADDKDLPVLVRATALRALPLEAALTRCEAWLAQPKLARAAASALGARGDTASRTMLLRACLDQGDWVDALPL